MNYGYDHLDLHKIHFQIAPSKKNRHSNVFLLCSSWRSLEVSQKAKTVISEKQKTIGQYIWNSKQIFNKDNKKDSFEPMLLGLGYVYKFHTRLFWENFLYFSQ